MLKLFPCAALAVLAKSPTLETGPRRKESPVKGNVIVALVVGIALGVVLDRVIVGNPTPAKPSVAVAPTLAPSAPAAPKPAEKPGSTEDPNAVYRILVGDSPVWGSATAKVTIVEGTDFQCPYCSKANDTLKQIKESYGPQLLRVSIKQNPLPFHPFAHMAAEAALAAHEQGKYWQMHDMMFDNQKNDGALERASLEKYAQGLGLDMSRFKTALDQQKFKDKIDSEQKQLQILGAGGTPSFFINGRKVIGAQPFERFKAVIDEEIKKADALLAKGVRAEALYDETIKNAATSPVMVEAPPSPSPAAQPTPPPEPTIQKVNVPAYSYFKGPKAAKVTIVEWSDFQCPYCSKGADVAHQILKDYPADVKFVFRHQPLPFHDKAMGAAKAAIAAGRQGKFFEMHDKMFGNQALLGEGQYEAWAKELQLDLGRFKADLASAAVADEIKKDQDEGNRFGANGTPTFFVNGRKVEGAQPIEQFKSLIDQDIKRANELIKGGTRLPDVYEKLLSLAPPPPPPPPEPARVKLDPGNAPLKGSKSAAVQIYLFSDFQCPYCSKALEPLHAIEQNYGDKVAIYFKQFPLPFHDKAQLAAEASLAAHEQGKFWPMHDKLFGNQSALARQDLERYAQDLGLDLNKFRSALDSGKFKAQVKKDSDQGSTAGVSGTPSFVINGKLVVGAQPFEEFKKVIDAEMQPKR
jgi:protein-disulfide isomerase